MAVTNWYKIYILIMERYIKKTQAEFDKNYLFEVLILSLSSMILLYLSR